MDPQNPWKTIRSRIAYQNPWLQIREDDVIRPDGEPGIYGVVEIRPSIGVLAFNQKRELALVGQWRYPSERYTWEIVRGGSSEGEADLLEVAKRELQEETGFLAQSWQPFGKLDVCNGVTTDVQHVFIAQDLQFVGTHFDPVEEITTEWQPFEQVFHRVMQGEITEVCSVAAILRYAHTM